MVAYAVFIKESTTDAAEMAIYAGLLPAASNGFKIKRLAQYGQLDVLEGAPIEGAVILEFTSMEEAKAWYNSPAYRAAAAHRFAGATFRAFLVDGL